MLERFFTSTALLFCISIMPCCYSMHPDLAASDFLKNYEVGFEMLKNALHDKNMLLVLQNDRTFLRNFPLDLYMLKHVSNFGYVYLDHINDCIKDVLRKNGAWESGFTPIIKRSTKPGTIALDIGAHIGTHTVAMSQSVGSNGLVVAFEPQGKIFRELYMNMLVNNCNNVIPVRCALENSQTIMKMRQDIPGNEGASYLTCNGIGQDAVAIRLDDFNFTNVSFIKIDAENAELEILQGARETITKNRPTILIEIQGNYERAKCNKENMRERALQVKRLLGELQYNLSHITCDEYLATPH
jgi:FkbM family methyltransferase